MRENSQQQEFNFEEKAKPEKPEANSKEEKLGEELPGEERMRISELHERDECGDCGNLYRSESSCWSCRNKGEKIEFIEYVRKVRKLKGLPEKKPKLQF